MKGVTRFGKKGKLSPRYIGPYKISKRVGNIAYELELPQELAAVHSVFYISMLKKCMGDHSLTMRTEDISIKDILSYEEIPVQILDRQVRKLRTKEVASVKVLWRNQVLEKRKKRGEKRRRSNNHQDIQESLVDFTRGDPYETQVPRASIRFAVDPVQYFRVSGSQAKGSLGGQQWSSSASHVQGVGSGVTLIQRRCYSKSNELLAFRAPYYIEDDTDLRSTSGGEGGAGSGTNQVPS
ncbi:hypothetical protein MTR67_013696 [Solanum verrucosum]|uniref:Tf2-1-like SH3-like domain-containing protein n=1 Tax=Solanum verrucosum TaxID=315347 RepID=A0AAF0QBQ3_SOLVR|nr:hypothetical protein MTR67_013696 [Solanum verrucosum]